VYSLSNVMRCARRLATYSCVQCLIGQEVPYRRNEVGHICEAMEPDMLGLKSKNHKNVPPCMIEVPECDINKPFPFHCITLLCQDILDCETGCCQMDDWWSVRVCDSHPAQN